MYITVHDTVVILAYKVWNYTSRVTTSMGLAGSSSAGCLLSGTVGDSKEDPGDMRGGIYELSPWKFFRKAWTWFMGKQGIWDKEKSSSTLLKGHFCHPVHISYVLV